jgi:mannan endo-1,4-beta-mannosidase
MLFTFSAATAQPDDYAGFRVVGRHLYDGAGEKVVLVGVNKMVIWTDIDGVPSFSEIARTGANAVRIVWLSSGTAEQLDTAITNAINEDLIPLVDCHDTTGDWSKLAACVDYWVRPDVLTVIRKHEPYLLINIANEADDGSLRDIDYKAGYELAIRRMRAANIRVPLVIDGQGYASRIDNLQKNAPYLMQVDPLQNVLFSIHLYWPSARFGANVDDLVTSELRESAEMGLPLIVGEFAYEAVGCVGEIPYRTIIEQAHLNEIGWFAWEWGPGNQDCSSLDMTEDGLFDTLHGWGLEVAITNPYSIQNVAVRPQSILNLEPVATGIEVPQPASDNLPDLVLTDIAWSPETPLHDAPVTFTATVENRGDAPTASSFSVTLWVNGERLEPFASDTPLESGGSVTVTGVWESAVAGNFIVAGWVDSDSTLDERDAHNNLLTTHGVVKLFASS